MKFALIDAEKASYSGDEDVRVAQGLAGRLLRVEEALANLGPGQSLHLTTLDLGVPALSLSDPCTLDVFRRFSDAVEQARCKLGALVVSEL